MFMKMQRRSHSHRVEIHTIVTENSERNVKTFDFVLDLDIYVVDISKRPHTQALKHTL